MPSEMFGAPIGISAAEDQINQNVYSGLQAQKTLGEIGMQPADLALKQARARYYGAEAGKLEAQQRDLETMQRLEQAVALKRAQGQDATTQDAALVMAGPPKPRSMADPLEQLVNAGEDQGVPARLLAPLAEKASTIRSHEATAASAQAEQVIRQLTAKAKQAERIGALATYGVQGPQQYAQMRMQASQEGLPINTLPEDYAAAVPILHGAIQSSVTAKDQITQQLNATKENAQEARWRAANARDAASVTVAGARTKLITERYDQLRKNGGDGSPEAKKAREELTLSREALRKARDRKEFPPAPLDPAARQFEKQYSAANGARFLWSKDPQTGKGVAVQLSPPPGSKAAAAIPAQGMDTADQADEGNN